VVVAWSVSTTGPVSPIMEPPEPGVRPRMAAESVGLREPSGPVLGQSVGPFEDRFDADRVGLFAAATGQPDPRLRPGDVVPPGAAMTLLWSAQNAARDALVPHAFQEAATGGVHGEHDLVLHRPLTLDEPLRTWVEGWGARPAGANSVVTLHYVTRDARDEVVVEQWWSTVWLDLTCAAEGCGRTRACVSARSPEPRPRRMESQCRRGHGAPLCRGLRRLERASFR
jgi:hypothetical protein